MASESSGGGAASVGRAKQLKRASAVGGFQGNKKAGIPFKSGFRTKAGQAQFKARGGVNRKVKGTR